MTFSPGTSKLRWVAACVALTAMVTSCGSDDSSAGDATTTSVSTDTTTTTVATDDVCADREALRSSVDALADVDVRAEGTNGVEAAVDEVSTDLEALSASAGSELEPQVTALQRQPR